MLTKVSKFFSTKKSTDFFWTEVCQGVKAAEYAVRGLVPMTAANMKEQLRTKTKKHPFDQITFCNIGNPQEFHQKPITFNRQVTSCVINPQLIKLNVINKDATSRAQRYLDLIISAGSYTQSLGIRIVRESISNYIAKNDNVPPPPINHIFLTEGASQGVHIVMESIIANQNDAIMIPVPQYPLYSATITMNNGSICPYYLNQDKGWQLDYEQLARSLATAKKQGKHVKLIVVINPGNPTGALFNQQTIKKIIEFSVKNRLVLIADQVYRQNVYKEGAKFISFRRVLETMPKQYKDHCQLISLHSVSKGLLGECGLRGGYMYLHNFNPQIIAILTKLKTISLCSNSIGQIMVDLMCSPPLEGVSLQTKALYLKQTQDLYNSLKKRAKLVTDSLRKMKNITINEIQGAMYAFPQIKFSSKAIQAAGTQAPDVFYCLEVLKNTGIVLVPGSGFKQKQGTHHFRITTLILPEEKLHDKLQLLINYNEKFHKMYE